jgi:hypothetical protein
MNAKLFIKKNAGTILSVMGSIGVVATAITAARAAPKAIKLLDDAREEKGSKLSKMEIAQIGFKTYLPVGLVSAATITCIMSANVLSRNKQANITSAYALLDQSYKDYRRKVIEMYGEETDHKIIEAIAVDRAKEVHISASYMFDNVDLSLDDRSGKPVLWYEEYSKRFFEATLEQILSAEYHLNRNYILRGCATINEMYDFFGLDPVEWGDDLGWEPMDESEFWIEFNHFKAKLDDGTEFYILDLPFAPRKAEIGYF